LLTQIQNVFYCVCRTLKHDEHATKSYLATRLSVLHNYFDSRTKLFLDLYLIKFLNTSKPFFLYAIRFTQLFSQEYR